MSQLIDQRTTARLEAIPATSGPLVFGAATRVLPATPVPGPQRRVSLFEQISINVYTFAGNFQWQSLMVIVIPSLVVKFLGEANKDINLAMVVIWGTLVAFAVNPLIGAISDYVTFRLGRRRPFLIAGLIVNKHDALPLYRNELVQMFLLIAAVRVGVVVYSVLTVKETPLDASAKFELAPVLRKFFFKPSTYPDFSWVLLARFLMMMGMWGIFYFLQYYADDVLGGPGVKTILFGSNFSGEVFVGTLVLPVVFLCSVPASLLAGWLSDRHGRKIMVYVSGALMALVCAVFILFQSQYGALVAAAFFGIGNGAYTSVDWALAADALPPTDEAGKFMGIWTAMGTLPQILGLFSGAVILQLLRGIPNHFGYTALFLLTIVYFALGTLAIRRVRNVR